jgi:lysozyme inhibitor LprI
MRRTVRLLLASIVPLPTVLFGQNTAPAAAGPSSSSPSVQQLSEFHNRAYAALHAEQERAKQPLCQKALTTVDVNQCTSQEFDTTERNYTTEITALGELVGGQRDLAGGSVRATPFDEAEATWHTYREQACNAFAGPQKNAGTIRPYLYETCLITLPAIK